MGVVRAAGRVWSRWAHDIGNFQSRAVLTVFYFSVLVPFALLMRAFNDPAKLRTADTGWSEWARGGSDIAAARRQY